MTTRFTLLGAPHRVEAPQERTWVGRSRDPALVAVATALTGLWALYWPSLSQDEISLILYADLISRGQVPNLDFFTPYGPGTFWPLAALFELTGSPSVFWSRMLGLTFHVLLALGVWALARRHGPRLAVLAGLLCGLLAADLRLIPYGWLAALSATVWSVVVARRRRWVLSGLLAATACTVRPEFIAVVAVVHAVQIPNRRALLREVGGFLLGGIAMFGHLVVAGPDLFRNVFLDRLLPNTRLPISSAPVGVRVGLILLAVALLVLVLEASRTRERPDITVAFFALLIVPQVLQRIDREHVLFVGVVVLPIALAVVLKHLDLSLRLPVGPIAWDRLTVATAVTVALLGATAAVVSPRGDRLTVGDRSIITAGPAASREIRTIAQAINREVSPSEVMFIGTEDMGRPALTPTYLYFLLPHLVPRAYYLELAPGVAERHGSRLIDDVASADVLVLSEFSDDQREALFPNIDDGSNEVNGYVTKHFCVERDVGFVRVYRRCAG